MMEQDCNEGVQEQTSYNERMLHEQDTIDLLVSGNLSLEQLIGPMPQRDINVISDISAQAEKYASITSKYFGTPERVEEVQQKGLVHLFKDLFLGTTKEQVVGGQPGIFGQQENSYQQLHSDLSEMKTTMPGLQSGLARLEDYIEHRIDAKEKLSETYLGVLTRIETVRSVKDDIEHALKDDSLSTKQKFKLKKDYGKAQRMELSTQLYANKLGARIQKVDEGIVYLSEELRLGQTSLNMLEIGVDQLFESISDVGSLVDYQESAQGMLSIQERIVAMSHQIREFQKTHLDFSYESSDVLVDMIKNNPYQPLMSQDENQSFHHQVDKVERAYDQSMNDLHDKVRAILILDQERAKQ